MLGLGAISRKVFGTPNDRKIKAVRPVVEQINALEAEVQSRSDSDLIAKTQEDYATIVEGACVFLVKLPGALVVPKRTVVLTQSGKREASIKIDLFQPKIRRKVLLERQG